jgi:hypothetical protein
MVVNNLNVAGAMVAPRETDSPLVVDPDAVGTSAVALQRFQVISRRRFQIFQALRLMKIEQLTARRALNGLETPDEPILKQRGGLSGLERPYQTPSL